MLRLLWLLCSGSLLQAGCSADDCVGGWQEFEPAIAWEKPVWKGGPTPPSILEQVNTTLADTQLSFTVDYCERPCWRDFLAGQTADARFDAKAAQRTTAECGGWVEVFLMDDLDPIQDASARLTVGSVEASGTTGSLSAIGGDGSSTVEMVFVSACADSPLELFDQDCQSAVMDDRYCLRMVLRPTSSDSLAVESAWLSVIGEGCVAVPKELP